MKLKVDGEGKPVYVDNLPVFIHDDGKELPFDAKKVVDSLAARNAENKASRERYEAAESKLALFGGLDPAKTVELVTKMKDVDLSKMVASGDLEKVKNELNTAWQGKLDTSEAARKAAEGKLNSHVIGGSFRESKFLKEKTKLIPEFAQSYFGEFCRVGENGNIQVFSDKEGKNAIFSRKSPGEVAPFDEAMEILIDQHPQKGSILLSGVRVGAGGQNNGGQGGQGADGKPVMARSQWDSATADVRQAHLKAGGTVQDQ